MENIQGVPWSLPDHHQFFLWPDRAANTGQPLYIGTAEEREWTRLKFALILLSDLKWNDKANLLLDAWAPLQPTSCHVCDSHSRSKDSIEYCSVLWPNPLPSLVVGSLYSIKLTQHGGTAYFPYQFEFVFLRFFMPAKPVSSVFSFLGHFNEHTVQ